MRKSSMLMAMSAHPTPTRQSTGAWLLRNTSEIAELMAFLAVIQKLTSNMPEWSNRRYLNCQPATSNIWIINWSTMASGR